MQFEHVCLCLPTEWLHQVTVQEVMVPFHRRNVNWKLGICEKGRKNQEVEFCQLMIDRRQNNGTTAAATFNICNLHVKFTGHANTFLNTKIT